MNANTRARATVQAELTAARQKYSAAAATYAADRDSTTAQRAVADARYRLDLLEAELAGIEAQRAAASQAQTAAELQQAIADTNARQQASSAASAAAIAAFETAASTLAQFAAAYHQALEAAQDAQAQVGQLTSSGNGLATFGASLVNAAAGSQMLDNLIGGLMHAHGLHHLRAERTDSLVDRNGKPNAKAATAMLTQHFAAGEVRVADVTRRARSELEARLAAIQTPAAA